MESRISYYGRKMVNEQNFIRGAKRQRRTVLDLTKARNFHPLDPANSLSGEILP